MRQSLFVRLAKAPLTRELLPLYLALGLAAVVMLLAFLFRDEVRSLGELSYWGIALLSFSGSASIIVPVPSTASVCVGGSILGLNPSLIALIAGASEMVGELTGYAVGLSGSRLLKSSRVYSRFEGWTRRRGGYLLFIFSVIPNPFFDLVGISAGALRYPIYLFLPVIFVGKTIKGFGIVYGCILGADRLIGIFGGSG